VRLSTEDITKSGLLGILVISFSFERVYLVITSVNKSTYVTLACPASSIFLASSSVAPKWSVA
jgi:hypothetical protein